MNKLLLLAFVLTTSSISNSPAEDNRIFELRVYHANPGRLDALHARFRDHTVALFEKHGMTQLGYFVPENNEANILVYWLAFENEKAHAEAWAGFRADPEWKKAYADSTKDGKLISKVDSIMMLATDYSPKIDMLLDKDDSRLFEWRTYTTNPDKLANLHARFRDHTCKLFEDHGMTNVAYWRYRDDEENAPVTLTYLIAHTDKEARDKSFGEFSKDPKWQAARKASEEEGKILIKGGVKSMFLKPTDYSPTK